MRGISIFTIIMIKLTIYLLHIPPPNQNTIMGEIQNFPYFPYRINEVTVVRHRIQFYYSTSISLSIVSEKSSSSNMLHCLSLLEKEFIDFSSGKEVEVVINNFVESLRARDESGARESCYY
jgi:hypothetical protein